MAIEKQLVSRVAAEGRVGVGDAVTAGPLGLAAAENLSQAQAETPARHRIKSAVAELGLTQRESQIVEMFAIGMSTQALANELHISSATVRTHLRKIFTKLEISSRVELLSLVITKIVEEIDGRAD